MALMIFAKIDADARIAAPLRYDWFPLSCNSSPHFANSYHCTPAKPEKQLKISAASCKVNLRMLLILTLLNIIITDCLHSLCG